VVEAATTSVCSRPFLHQGRSRAQITALVQKSAESSDTDHQTLFAGDVFDRPGGMFLGTASGSGTGIYRNASGTGTVEIPHDVPNETDAHFVLNLTG
jgi:hypothetical protein